MSFWERYRRLHNRRGFCWWSIVFGYPVARLLVVLVLPLRWITPTRLTGVGFLVKLASAGMLLVSGTTAAVIAFALLQASQVLDSMDGTLARARGEHSALGAILDKLTDEIGLFAICAAVGLRALWAGDGAWMPVLATWGALACVLTCYIYWVGRVLAPEALGRPAADGSDDVLQWPQIRREWARGWIRMPLCLEADLYLWIGVFALLDAWAVACVVVAVSQTLSLLAFAGYQALRVRRGVWA